MPLILAIEPDRKQAGQLTAMVRGRLHAELVLADSAERALESLGPRIPDLVLTSVLLSPKDETALGERLRALDGAAAHVQTLTIPVLASPSRSAASRAGGMLAALRRDKSKGSSAPDGCDPAVFAEQCKEYLERAAAERAAIVEQAATAPREPARAPIAPSPVTGAEWIVVREEETAAAAAPALDVADELKDFIADGGEPAAEVEYAPPSAPRNERAPIYVPTYVPTPAGYTEQPYAAQPAYEAATQPAYETATEPIVTADEVSIEPAVAEPPAAPPRAERKRRSFLGLNDDANGPASLLAAVAAFEADQPPAPVVESSVHAAAVEPELASTVDFDLSSLLESTPAPARPNDDDDDPVYELDPSMMATPIDLSSEAVIQHDDPLPVAAAAAEPFLTARSDTRSWPILEDLVEGWPARVAEPSAEPAAPADAPEDLHQWVDIIEALRRDAEQLQPPPPQEPAIVEPIAPEPINLDVLEPIEIAPPPPPEPPKAEASNGKKKKKKSRANPAQDEWGFFDPEQCGFAALIHKLEEITDPDDPPTPRRA